MTRLVWAVRPVHKRLVGMTHLDVRVCNPGDPKRHFEMRLIVDSGAFFTIAPERSLREVGIEPVESHEFEVADRRRIVREVGGALYQIGGRRGFAPVVFGKRGDAPLLGVVTLEALGLTLDPLRREVRRARLFLLSSCMLGENVFLASRPCSTRTGCPRTAS